MADTPDRTVMALNSPDGDPWLRITTDGFLFILERYAPPQEGEKGDGFGRTTYHVGPQALAVALVREGVMSVGQAAHVGDLVQTAERRVLKALEVLR